MPSRRTRGVIKSSRVWPSLVAATDPAMLQVDLPSEMERLMTPVITQGFFYLSLRFDERGTIDQSS